jgi:hypothetical protein
MPSLGVLLEVTTIAAARILKLQDGALQPMQPCQVGDEAKRELRLASAWSTRNDEQLGRANLDVIAEIHPDGYTGPSLSGIS